MPVSSSPRLFFLRHGETDWNVEGRLQGRRDVPLNPEGRAQAARAGRTLRKLLASAGLVPQDVAFQCSPLSRTRETLAIARRELGLPAEGGDLDDRLVEFTFGRWEGLTWPEVCASDPGLARAREADKWNFTPPGGESYAQLAERLAPWLAEQRQPSVVVSHGGVARALMRMIGGLREERAPTADIWQGRVLVFSGQRFDWR
ncbi:histidine phosphatase family protein [Rhodoblastus acidophilus]|uniref:Histidine phosphatase family protein n=1 Tax=Candidatus Rhodoblastus alkanivorans TaxID=2954117 RepID=A0ABS9Z934_9HYPH|nr:histidine phosphatase family protein [Candidatus Rhodoblastus alkanivorans]MCI4679271.1 histidine phosphatase family protein [Candidatus Rhodoblastus alkanivorans]MCI4684102.1 histidine phosphatase family protein [Candidatus Rhodoblastus alkanivorans]MDI4641422.1 histidine phosphatase family protein [Rhodoblastus acidophilus]